MLSRRNIRVKVMQTLYSVESMDNIVREGEPLRILNKKIEDAQSLLAYLILYLTEMAGQAEKSAIRRSQKLLPSESDLTVNTKISGNKIIWDIRENPQFKKAVEEFKLKYLIDEESVRKSFMKFSDSDTYTEYIAEPFRNKAKEEEILEYILENLMLADEDFISDCEEKFIHLNDDLETVAGLLKKVLSKPSSFDFLEKPDAEKMKFAANLLRTVLEKNDYFLELIQPKLQNWELDRIAVIDMILLKMGICEILYFDTIPTKVSLNEYIDIAKDYSTEKSGHFVNGILDSILKDLQSADRVHKKDFNKSV